MFRPRKAKPPSTPEPPSLRAALIECAEQFERDLLTLIKTHDDQWFDVQDESGKKAFVVGGYALFWFVADETLRRPLPMRITISANPSSPRSS